VRSLYFHRFGCLPISLSLFFSTLLPSFGQPPRWFPLTAMGPPTPDLRAVWFFSQRTGLVCGRVGSHGRLYRTTDGGATWTTIDLPGSPSPLNDLCAPGNGAFGVLVGDGSYVATTTDSGATWTQRSLADAWPTGGDVQGVGFIDSRTGFVVGRATAGSGPRFAATFDGGAGWNDVEQNGAANNLYDLDFFDALRGIAVGTGRRSRKSATSDGGRTWEPDAVMQIGYASGSDSLSISLYGVSAARGTPVAFAAGGKVYYPAPVFPEVRRTTDYGATWRATSMAGPGSGYSNPANDVIAVSSLVAFVSTDGGHVYRTTDGGISWNPEILPADVGTRDLKKFSALPDGTIVLVGAHGTVLRFDARPRLLGAGDTLRVDALCPGTLRSAPFGIRNIGTATLHIDSTAIDGGSSGIEIGGAGSSPDEIAAGRSDSIVLTVAAGTAIPGVHHATLRIRSDDAFDGGDTLHNVPIVIEIPEPLRLSRELSQPIDLGAVAVGRDSSRTFDDLLRAESSCPAVIDSLRFAIDREFTVTLSRSLWPPGRPVPIVLGFRPIASCERHDTLLVFHDAFSSPLRLPLSGLGVEPGFSVLPADTLDIGAVEIGTSRTGRLTVRNQRDGGCLDTVHIVSFRIVGPDANMFSTSYAPSMVRPDPLAPDGEVAAKIVATPSTIGALTAAVEIGVDDRLDTVILRAWGLPPTLATTDTAIVFEATAVGRRRDSSLAEFLANLSNADVHLLGAAISGRDAPAFIYRGPFDMLIRRGERATIDVTFAPDTPLPSDHIYQATLEVVTDIPSTLRILLRGSADVERMSIEPTSLDFGSAPVRSCRDTVMHGLIRNIGSAPLSVERIFISGIDSTAFEVLAPTDPSVVPPLDSLAVALRFCPVRLGDHQARLVIQSGAASSGDTVSLNGIGTEAILVGADSLRFSATRLGTTREHRIERALIALNESVDIETITVVGPDSNAFSLAPLQLPIHLGRGEGLDLHIMYTPLRRGEHSAQVVFGTGLGTVGIRLSGTGIYPRLAVITPEEKAVRTRIGVRAMLFALIVNHGDDTAGIDHLSMLSRPAFPHLEVPSLPRVLAPGDTLVARIDFVPLRFCEDTTVLTLAAEGLDERVGIVDTAFSIVGFGMGSELRSDVAAIDFGDRRVGSGTDSVIVAVLRNGAHEIRCMTSVRIDSIRIEGPDVEQFQVIMPAPDRLPSMVAPGDSIAVAVRFRSDGPGERRATLAIYFDGAGDSVVRIPLRGGAVASLRASLGEDLSAAPGETFRIPIVLDGRPVALDDDSLHAVVRFGSTLLRPLRVISADPRVHGKLEVDPAVGRAHLRLTGISGTTGGLLAELEVLVLLGDRLETSVGIDSVTVSGPMVRVVADTIRFTISGFCDASGRLVRFEPLVKLRALSPVSSDRIALEITLPRDLPVRLEVYDELGERVDNIADGMMSPGEHYEIVDTRALGEGVYYCVLTAGRFRRTIPIRVIR